MRRIQEGKDEVVTRAHNRVKTIIPNFSKVQFFNVRWKNNKMADKLANKGVKLKQGGISNNSPPQIKSIAC